MNTKFIKIIFLIVVVATLIMPMGEVMAASQDIAVTSIKMIASKIEVEEGKTATITVTVEPSNATNKEVSFISQNEKKVKVDNKGNITGVSSGTTVVTAVSKSNTSKKANCVVTVKRSGTGTIPTPTPSPSPSNVAVTKITLNSTKIEIEEGKTSMLKATVEPSNATDKEVSYSSSNEKIAKVDNSGKITGVKAGTAVIIATSKSNSSKKATCVVTVKPKEIKVTQIKLNKTNIEIEEGKTEKIEVTIQPSNATNKEIKYSTSDEKIAKVDSNGTITGLKEGTVTITAKSNNGKTANCKVTVKSKTLGFSGEKEDSLCYIQQSNKGYPVSGGSTNKYMACDAVSLTHAVILLTGDYSITPNNFHSLAVSMYGASQVNSVHFNGSSNANANVTVLRKASNAKYGVKYRNVEKSKWTVDGIKNILKNKHVILIGEDNAYFYKPDGSKRKHAGHTVMFYKYKNGYFYAKDSASDGGAMCPYPESYAKEFFKNAEYITEYYK